MASQDEQLARHHEALQRLSRSHVLQRAGREAAIREACIVAAGVLDIDRVGVWLFADDRRSLRCVSLFERPEDRHSAGTVVKAEDLPIYFRALQGERTIAADDARADPRTAALAADYLDPLGIGALLDAPILIAGECVGVVCHEHVGGPRPWPASEQLFAGSIADYVALALQWHELEERRTELEQALVAAQMGIWSWEVGSEEVRWSERVGPLFGKPPGWAPAQPSDYLDLVIPEDREALGETVRRALESGEDGYAFTHRTRAADGQIRWLETRGSIERGPDGQPVRMRGTVIDVTERRELEAKLLHAQKMEAVGRLAGGVAHDFNNLLTAISGTAELARFDLEDAGQDELAHDLEDIVEAAARGGALTKQLLTFARRHPTRPVAVDLNAMLRRVDGLLRRVIGEDVELVTQLADHPLVTRIDPSQLEQVVMNLAVNARDAMPEGGRLTICTGVEGWASSERVVLRVVDTGVGMSPEVLDRAFEPFFTTKDWGQGTGLGLATCHGIVEQAEGGMSIASEPGRGTTVRVTLPRVDDHPEQIDVAAPERVRPGDETVLVVEDEPIVRRVITETLGGAGYRVLASGNPTEARAALEQAEGPVDLLITDVVMPNESGVRLADELRAAGTVRHVLLISGYPFEQLGPECPPDTEFLPKPFTAMELARRVRELLDD